MQNCSTAGHQAHCNHVPVLLYPAASESLFAAAAGGWHPAKLRGFCQAADGRCEGGPRRGQIGREGHPGSGDMPLGLLQSFRRGWRAGREMKAGYRGSHCAQGSSPPLRLAWANGNSVLKHCAWLGMFERLKWHQIAVLQETSSTGVKLQAAAQNVKELGRIS